MLWRLLEAKPSKKAVLRVRCLRSVSFIYSKGAFVKEGSILEDSWNFWDDPCENWRVTCEGLNFVKYGGQLGPPSCNHQWSRGACLDLGTDFFHRWSGESH